MENKRIRIVDIAEELGVSTATVSNVIHGKTKKISDETVHRVQELLEKRQYIPSMAGILLAQNDSRIIGVVINDHEKYESHALEDAFIASSLNHLSAEIEKAGYFMMVKVTDKWNEIPKFASMWNMEGLVIIGFCENDYKKMRDLLHIPFVVYDGYFEEPGRICNLAIDNFGGGFQIGRYFRKSGHRNALCISDNDICMDLERYQGFHAAMENPDADPAEKSSVKLARKTGEDFLLIPMTKKERRKFYQDHLEMFKSVTAVFAVSDYYAIDLIHFLQEQNIRVPEDISVAGFDDSPLCERAYPTLTAVKQDGKRRAELAISILQELKEGKEEGQTITLPVTLVKRQSTRQIAQI